jgi:two-component system cell cycle sensor histidine kinase/response regulator CckA
LLLAPVTCIAIAAAAMIDVQMAAVAALAALPGWTVWWLGARISDDSDSHRRHLEETQLNPRVAVDRRGRIIWANTLFRQRFDGVGSDALAAMATRLCDDDASRATFAKLRNDVVDGTGGQLTLSRRRSDGGSDHFDILAMPWPERPGASSWLVLDAGARLELEALLAAERTRLADFLDNAPVGFFSCDSEGRLIFVNATLIDWLGYRGVSDELRRLRLHDILGVKPIGASPHDPLGGGDIAQTGDALLVARDNRRIPVEITQTVLRTAEGALSTRAVVRDLRTEQAMAAALERTERGFRRLFEEAPVAIVRLDATGVIEECNAAFARLSGLAPDHARGRPFVDLLRAEDRAEAADRLERIARGAESSNALEARLLAAGGNEITAALYANRVDREPAGRAELVIHALDVTEQKRLEVQFAQSQKMQAVGQLAGGIAHDFNNLLTAMIGFCDLLLLRHRAGDPSFADIMQVKQNANRAANLVRQLLAFSRQQTLQPKVLNITDALSDVAHLLRRLIGENIELRMIHARDLYLVRVDQGQFEQVIINLAVNARDAMPNGGKLTVRTANLAIAEPQQRGVETIPAGDYVTIEVADTGTGIPPENLSRIFEPFFSTKEVGSGTGLGLSTVYGIIKQTGGFVSVESQLRRGASFKILLPRWKGEAAKSVDAGGEARRRDTTGAAGVLLVEDEDAVRLFSARALRNKGYKVIEARSGENALELLEKAGASIDVLVTDVVMPQMDGTELVRRVREKIPSMKVICISGYAEETIRKKLVSAEDIHFLPKPFTLEQLAGKVKEVCL